MNKWVQIAGAIIIVACLGVLYVLKDGDGGGKASSRGDHPPTTNYNDDPGLKGLKIPSNN